MRPTLALLVLTFLLISAPEARAQQTMNDLELMTDLKGSAPQSVVEHATIMNMGADGKVKVVHEGSNGWACMDPGGAPMCADKAAMEWVKAWQEKGPAPQKTGFIYMLKGDAGTSNTDPYANGPAPDNHWIATGPHVMVVGPANEGHDGLPKKCRPDTTRPYVMWAGTL